MSTTKSESCWREACLFWTHKVVYHNFWLRALFFSFGIFAPRNATVTTALFVSGLSVSGAVFLILEMYKPYGGLIQVSSAPLRTALMHLGQ